ncbi:MAG: hypothetical protein K1X78_20805 [Verrucomicrobiaceae bacterium]|nr:hypothetical protein [Verrucomicrobiaceae bacterium]
MTATLTANGLLEFPDEYREADSLQPGQPCDIERLGHGEYRLRFSEPAPRNWVEWLLACPEKDWFVQPERGEMTSLEPPATFAE